MLRFFKKLLRILFKFIGLLFAFMLFVASLFYLPTVIYDFPPERPFAGDSIYNPYENLPDSVYRANFHAHTVAWKGVTNGHNTEKDIFDAYTKRGYAVAGISNYHKISRYAEGKTALFIPIYEHGYNILKSHYLSMNPDGVSYFDFPLFQLSSHQQKIIENLKKHHAFVAMAHPKFGGGRTFGNMRDLVNYDFTEVLNHYNTAAEYYDQALSAGRLTWILGDDDTHDIYEEASFQRWTMVFSPARNVNAVLQSMKYGKHYAVLSRDQSFKNRFIACKSVGKDTFECVFESPLDSILCIGQNGKVRQVALNTNRVRYAFAPRDTYIRILAKDTNTEFYLNPLVRYDGVRVPLNTYLRAEINGVKTWLFRSGILLVSLLSVLLIRKILIRR